MKRFILPLISLVTTAFLGCKTVSRTELPYSMSSISIKLPDEFKSHDSKLSLTRTNSDAPPKVVRGSEMQLKLPKGEYKLDLSLIAPNGDEFEACDNSKKIRFSSEKEEPILDICKKNGGMFVAKTLATTIIPPKVDPPLTPIPGEVPANTGSANSTGQTGTNTEETPTNRNRTTTPIDEGPLVQSDSTCFGLPAQISHLESENMLVIRMDQSLKNKVLTVDRDINCKFSIRLKKEAGQLVSGTAFALKFTIKNPGANIYMQVSATGSDGSKVLQQKCVGVGLNDTSMSDREHECEVLAKEHTSYNDSCKSTQDRLFLKLEVKGFPKPGESTPRFDELKISEIRYKLPPPSTTSCVAI